MITLEAVFDDSDLRTDYFSPDRPIFTWFVSDIKGKVTEKILRRALEALPEWLRQYSWTYRKGEAYSMSDHPHGQLRVEDSGLKYKWGDDEHKVGLLIDTTYDDLFAMNHSKNVEIPATKDEFVKLLREKETERVLTPKQKEEKELLEKVSLPPPTLPQTQEEPSPCASCHVGGDICRDCDDRIEWAKEHEEDDPDLEEFEPEAIEVLRATRLDDFLR